MILTKLFSDFFKSERAGGLVLLACTAFSLIITNFYPPYNSFWHQVAGSHSVGEWINDGLMAIFFLMIGLELEREIYAGELSTLKNAVLPVVAAVGGMVVPALIYILVNEPENFRGFGIPMANI